MAPTGPGLIAALNTGFNRAEGDIVAITDDDTLPSRLAAERIEERFEEDPRLGGLGGRDRMVLQGNARARADEIMVGRVQWFGRVVGNHHLGAGEMREVDILKGANMAIRSVALGDRRIDTTLRGRAPSITPRSTSVWV